MATTFMIARDGHSNISFALQKPNDIRHCVLAGDTIQTVTVPDDCNAMLIAAETTLFWSDELFTLPIAGPFQSTTAEMNAALRYGLTPGSTLYIGTVTSQRVSIGFYTSSNMDA